MKKDPGYRTMLKTIIFLMLGAACIDFLGKVVNGWELYLAGWLIALLAFFAAEPKRFLGVVSKERDFKAVEYIIIVLVIALIYSVGIVSLNPS